MTLRDKLRVIWRRLRGKKTKIGAVIYLLALALQHFFPQLTWLELMEKAGEIIIGGGTLDAIARYLIEQRRKKKGRMR